MLMLGPPLTPWPPRWRIARPAAGLLVEAAQHALDIVGSSSAVVLRPLTFRPKPELSPSPPSRRPPRWTWKPSTCSPLGRVSSVPSSPISAVWIRAHELGQPLTLIVIGSVKPGSRRSSSAIRPDARCLVSTIASLQNSIPVQAMVCRRNASGQPAGPRVRARRPVRPSRPPGRRVSPSSARW